MVFRPTLIVAGLVLASSASLAAEMLQPDLDIVPEHVIEIQPTALQNNDDTALFSVIVTPASGDPVVYQWKLEKSGSGSWMTIGVSPPMDRGGTI